MRSRFSPRTSSVLLASLWYVRCSWEYWTRSVGRFVLWSSVIHQETARPSLQLLSRPLWPTFTGAINTVGLQGVSSSSPSSHHWVNTCCHCSAYLLAAGTFSPLYGKLSNMFGEYLFLTTHAENVHHECTRAKATPLFMYIRVLGLFPQIGRLIAFLILTLPDRIRTLWCGAEYDLVDRVQGTPRYWRWWSNSTLIDHHLGYCPLERVSTQKLKCPYPDPANS